MLVCLAFHPKDAHLALSLLQWCKDLDGDLKGHDCVLIADAATDWFSCLEILKVAESLFSEATIITTESPIDGWIAGANNAFRMACLEAQKRGRPFLFLEPDACPLKRGWLAIIEAEYQSIAPKRYLGGFVESNNPKQPGQFMEGVAVYPPEAMTDLEPLWDNSKAWVVFGQKFFEEHAADAKSIHQLWGQVGNAPTFVEHRKDLPTDPTDNVMGLNFLRPEAALFHRNKDGTLLRLLRRKLFPPKHAAIAVVLPFYNGDDSLMLHHLRWMARLHDKKEATAVLHHDGSSSPVRQKELIHAAQAVFTRVFFSRYKCSTPGWPTGPNQSFRAAALYMQDGPVKMPWLFMEADAIPVKPDWLEQLCDEYERGGKPFMGCVIEGITPGHHTNGVAVYPSNAASILPHAMSATNLAFDTESTRDGLIPQCHRANQIIQHCREQPGFESKADVAKWLQPTTVLYHPDKSGHLCKFL